MKTIRDIIDDSVNESRSAAEQALQQLLDSLSDDGAIVTWLHGPVGTAKSAVLREFMAAADSPEVLVIRTDCRNVEPTPAGLIESLSPWAATPPGDLDRLAREISRLSIRVVLIFENYEVLRLADSWLRNDLIPALDASVRIVFSSREPPGVGWISSAAWQQHFKAVALPADDSIDPVDATLRMLEEVSAPDTLRAIDSLSITRRITHPMIAALCPDSSAQELYDSLAALSFVNSRSDGLAFNPVLQNVLSKRLQAADPGRYRRLQRAAWRHLKDQLKQTVRADLWRSTADVIYLIENPVIREAFFPSESAQYSVEPAAAADQGDIFDIAARTDPADAVEALQLWWKYLPSAFHVVRDDKGSAAGFYCAAKPVDLQSGWMKFDPVANLWLEDRNRASGHEKPSSLFLRRWLSAAEGEQAGAVQAAAWVDIKRSYLELRPDLRRVYLTLQDIGPYAAVATRLGFQVIEEATAVFGDTTYATAMLDFGPGSVDGWICNLLAAESGVVEDQLLDPSTKELLIAGERFALTPLEYGVVAMLESRAGSAVSRTELLQQVWGHGYEGGSNVVDAVIRGLRKKIGDGSLTIDTVRGVGYRLCN